MAALLRSRPLGRYKRQEFYVSTPKEPSSPIALSIAGAVGACGGAISRTRLFSLVKSGEIDARRVGRRTVIVADSLRAYIERQPRVAA
jgi:hypothetical protein